MRIPMTVVGLISVLALADCGGGGGGGSACESVLSRFEECGVYEGDDQDCYGVADTDLEECLADCVDEASCDEIDGFVCGSEESTCVEDCFDADFVCDDGETTDADYECDGEEDCDDGSDEADCDDSVWTCGDDEEIPGVWVCDGEDDCDDGSDEEDCGEFTCPAPLTVGSETLGTSASRAFHGAGRALKNK